MKGSEVWTGLRVEKDVDGEGKYSVVDPSKLYHGKGYSEWASDWFNWYLSADADRRNSGPVVFLRSHGLPNKVTGANVPEVPSQELGAGSLPTPLQADSNYTRFYKNDPNVRIGADRLQIHEDQAVFIPIITAYELATTPNKDWGKMQDFTGLTIDYGDNPPDPWQLTINNVNVNLTTEAGELEMSDFRIVTPIFTAVVPDTDYGRSIKDFLEIVVEPGSYPAMVDGYFVMLRFKQGSYWIHAMASSPREVGGVYFSELLYQIEVQAHDRCKFEDRNIRNSKDMIIRKRPARNEFIIQKTYYEKEKIGELTSNQLARFKKHIL